jgi:hypothetical protein
VHELRNPLIQLLQRENKAEFSGLLQNRLWSTKLAYLCDIFELLNKMNTSMQGKGENNLTSADKIRALKYTLEIWNRKAKYEHFENVSKNI